MTSRDQFDTKTISGRRRKKKNDRVQARGLCNFISLIYNDNNIGFLKITDVNINYVTSVIIKPMLTSTR